MEIPEEEDYNTEISGVDQNTEYPRVNANNAMPGNPPEPTPINNNNTPKVETVDESNTEEDKNETKKQYKTRKGLSSK